MQIAAGEFKAKCLKLMDEVQQSHQEIVITKFGKPIAKLVPVEPEKKRAFLGCMKGKGKIVGDIISPIWDPWEADQ